MGVDLTLLPFDGDFEGLSFSHTVLNLERRRELWDAIQEAKITISKVSAGFTSYHAKHKNVGYGYGVTTKDAYDDPLLFTTAERLMQFHSHEGVQDNYKNRAVWAYLEQLPPETKVALFWC